MALTLLTEVELDMSSPGTTIVHAKQNDSSSRVIRAHLLNNGVAWAVPSGVFPVIRFRKQDRIGGYYDQDDRGEYAIAYPKPNDKSFVDIIIAQQVLTTPGDVAMEINFYDSTKVKLTSFAWYVKVEASALDDGTIVSSEYYNALTGTAARVVEAAKKLPDNIGQYVGEWLSENVTVSQGVVIDPTLTIPGQAADAYVSGHLVTSSQTQPTAPGNRIWVKPSTNEIVIPTMDDFNDLINSIADATGPDSAVALAARVEALETAVNVLKDQMTKTLTMEQ